MNPLKAPPSLLHGFGIPVGSSINSSTSTSLLNSNINNTKSRTVSLGGDGDLFLAKTIPPPSTPPSASELLPSAKEAELLMSFSSIAKNEIKANPLWNDDDEEEARDEGLPGFPQLPLFSPGGSYSRRPNTSAKKNSLWSLGPRLSPLQLPSESSSSSSEDDDEDSSDSSYHIGHQQGRKRTKKQDSYQQSQQQQKRARTVSIDSPMPESPVMMKSRGGFSYGMTGVGGHSPNLVSPLSTPVLVKAGKVPTGFAIGKKSRLRSKAKRERRPSHKAAAAAKKMAATTSCSSHAEDDKKRLAVTVPKGKTLKTILRKKFSWKNYPEVSYFLLMQCPRLEATWRATGSSSLCRVLILSFSFLSYPTNTIYSWKPF